MQSAIKLNDFLPRCQFAYINYKLDLCVRGGKYWGGVNGIERREKGEVTDFEQLQKRRQMVSAFARSEAKSFRFCH